MITADDETLPPGAALRTVTPTASAIIYNDGIPVAWESTDTAILKIFGLLTTTISNSQSHLPSHTDTAAPSTGTSTSPPSKGTPPPPNETIGPIWTGSGPMLTGSCATPEQTLLDLSTAYLWAQVVGCVADKLNCCPYAISIPLSRPFKAASISSAINIVPRITLTSNPRYANALPRCPDDYASVGSTGCCPM